MKTHYFKEYLVLIKITHTPAFQRVLIYCRLFMCRMRTFFSEQISYPCENREWLPVLHDSGSTNVTSIVKGREP